MACLPFSQTVQSAALNVSVYLPAAQLWHTPAIRKEPGWHAGVGYEVGARVGNGVGNSVGNAVGDLVGNAVGNGVGAGVGISEHAVWPTLP